MTPGRPFPLCTFTYAITGAFLLLMASSCIIVKNYPANQPFVYKTNINITGNIASDTAELIAARLKAQLDDSIRARSVSKVLWSVMKSPPVYKDENAAKSVIFMKALLNSMGYFRDTITRDTVVHISGDQQRTTVTFDVKPGKVVRIDSFTYNIGQQELQALALASQKDAFVKKGDPFAKVAISAELDRLVELYRNHGYFRFGREVMIGLWDTLDVSLLRPTFDPAEQLEILQKLQARRENPTANLELRLKPGFDSSKLTKYYVGNITVFPEYGPDTSYERKEEIVDGVNVVYYRKVFKPRIIRENIFFQRGDLYDLRTYIKTINRFNSLGAWRLVNVEPSARKGQDTVDYLIRLTPAKKYSFTANLEGSRNQSAISGNLFGIGVNLGWQNRNFGRSANISTTNLRYGIEISDSSFIQTQQFVLSHNIYFPRLIPRFKVGKKIRENTNSILSFNAGNTERKDLFNLTTLNGSFGWEYQDSNIIFSLRPLNIEYSYLKPRQKLLDLFIGNPALKNIFTDGLISSIIGGVTITNDKEKVKKIFRANAELSGLLVSGFMKGKFFDDNLYRFIKLDAETIRKVILRRSALVLRLFGGVGYEFNSTVNPDKRNNLPFFKQYFAGGPNSMRAWGLRKLGPGSDTLAFSGVGSTPERYGDVQVEGNIEYRFPIGRPFGIKVDGALFTDIGNIWFLKNAPGRSPRQVFNLGNLPRDLAVGVGLGFRVDFDFFVIRLDYSYKAKDPSPSPDNIQLRNKWFGYPLLKGDQFQLGISYPFIL